MTVTLALVIGAFVLTLANAMERCPIWVPVLLLVLVHLLGVWPK